MHPRRAKLVLSIIAAGALVAACGTSSASTAPGDTGSAATAGAQGTPAPGATAAPGQTLGDLGGAAGALANLSSYKVTMAGTGTGPFNVELIKINGSSPATSFIETSGSAVVFRVIEIGTDNWVDQGTGTYAKNLVPNSTLAGMMGAFDPGVMFSNASKIANFDKLENKGVESKNGVQSIHLHADQNTQLPAGASPIPAGATIDLWVAVDGGYLVGLETVGFGAASGGADLTIEVSNINDSSLTVTPPS